MNKVCIYDPLPMGNEYFTKMFAAPLRQYCSANGIPCSDLVMLTDIKDTHVVLLTDHLSEERIFQLKENRNKIIGFNVTDSSYISQGIRYAKNLPLVDLIFMVSGVPITNEGNEIDVDDEFNVSVHPKLFLDEHAWGIFNTMRMNGQLKSLPYVPWQPIPDVPWSPYDQRSQKVILRGGGHARRFILALFLMLKDKLDCPNSGFVLFPYFAEDMNPQFRFCDSCRASYRQHNKRAVYEPNQDAAGCNGPHRKQDWPGTEWTFRDIGQWNNRCPKSFFWMAEQFAKRHGAVDMKLVEEMLNARWLDPKEHMARMGRILFTADLKWVHSIYQPQRFWEAASAGVINVMPQRALQQTYFPETKPLQHFLVFEENMQHLDLAFSLDAATYKEMALETRHLFDTWLNPGRFGINANLLNHIIDQMRQA